MASQFAPIKVGYARVSTDEQSVALQLDALLNAGCSTIFEDKGISGATFSRPGLDKALKSMRCGDTLVVWRLDRLGRSLSHLIDVVSRLKGRGIHFHSISEVFDTSSAGGVLVFHMMAALAEFERGLISERTRAGMAAARHKGIKMGRKPALSKEQQSEALILLRTQPVKEVAHQFNVHRLTLERLHKNTACLEDVASEIRTVE